METTGPRNVNSYNIDKMWTNERPPVTETEIKIYKLRVIGLQVLKYAKNILICEKKLELLSKDACGGGEKTDFVKEIEEIAIAFVIATGLDDQDKRKVKSHTPPSGSFDTSASSSLAIKNHTKRITKTKKRTKKPKIYERTSSSSSGSE